MGVVNRSTAAAKANEVKKVEVPESAVVMPVAKAPTAKIELELAVHNRYVLNGITYEKGVCYQFSTAQAEIMRQLTSELGIPLFRNYKSPHRAPTNNDGVPVRDMSVPKEVKALGTVSVTNGRIDIGDDDTILPGDADSVVTVGAETGIEV